MRFLIPNACCRFIRQQILEKQPGRGTASWWAVARPVRWRDPPGCFHVFVYATASAKRDWFTRAFPNQAPQADQLLASFDKRRAAVIRKFYQQEWCSRSLYHMLLNSCMGTEAMIAAVENAASLASACAQ